jgi:uncharacterized membrane protein (DUF4010 family)
MASALHSMRMDPATDLTDERAFLTLGSAFAIGLLFGLERGWHGFQEDSGQRVAGVRTYGLIGLLGGATGLLSQILEPPVYGIAFLGIAGMMVAAYAVNYRSAKDAGITSLVAALLAFALGSLAAVGEAVAAGAAAVVAVLILGFKPQLHSWVSRLQESELQATLKLLVISVVALPILPDRGFGPGAALNPYEIWWMVVLVASISYAGYFAVKVAGAKKGIVATSLFAGLASSTALTLHLARLAARDAKDANLLAAGVLIANGTLFPRILVIAALIHPPLLGYLAAPLSAMALLVYAPSLLLWSRRNAQGSGDGLKLENPLEIGTALRFGVFLAVVMLAGNFLAETFGGKGVLWLGAISGIADLNAITLSVSRMSQNELALSTATMGIVLAAAVNGVVKTSASAFVGGPTMGLRVGVPLLAASIVGVLVGWWTLAP